MLTFKDLSSTDERCIEKYNALVNQELAGEVYYVPGPFATQFWTPRNKPVVKCQCPECGSQHRKKGK